MTVTELAKLAHKMRKAQRAYLASGSNWNLKEVERLERKFDRALAEILGLVPKAPTLFAEDK